MNTLKTGKKRTTFVKRLETRCEGKPREKKRSGEGLGNAMAKREKLRNKKSVK